MQSQNPITTAIAWCAAWGEEKKPQYDLSLLQEMQKALNEGKDEDIPEVLRGFVEEAKILLSKDLPFPETIENLELFAKSHPILWNSKIGMVYGGATKIKQYVFEESKLPDIRGASARLDQINLIDLPAFFNKKSEDIDSDDCAKVKKWLNDGFPDETYLSQALIPELIIYSCGGNILAFCPSGFVDVIANAIEKRYTKQTLTANSCAVGDTFRLLELRLGLLRDNIQDTFWLEKYQQHYSDSIVEASFGTIEHASEIAKNFENHKSFNELTTKLAILFNQRRSGNNSYNRPSRCYPPMLETHPYLRRDEIEKRSAITKANNLPGEPYFSEPSAIKRQLGDRAKDGRPRNTKWYSGGEQELNSWVKKFEKFLKENPDKYQKYFGNHRGAVEIPESLTQLSKVSNGYVAYIYADGNNMGGFIQKIRTPQEYQDFSEDVDCATRYSVFQALAQNLQPRQLKGIDESKSRLKNGDFIHPFEIITIGGDDIIIIVPADKALQIAKTIGEQFESILLNEVDIKGVTIKGEYNLEDKNIDLSKCQRYNWQKAQPSRCQLSISSGVLITAYNTPIYYAEDLTKQLMKSAKDYGKKLKDYGYHSGTVDFLVMKSVTMISSNIKEFRDKALTKKNGATLKLYAAPYTLHELDGFLKAITALIKVNFPKSQLYQIRSFLEQGKRTASLNYYYFRSRLKQGQVELKLDFETAWCEAKTNKGNLAPWMYEPRGKLYETIWREMVDLYEFIEVSEAKYPQFSSTDKIS
ncbi:MAG: type III-B CRISPR-associated protein Cas10/Cmr2 [Scytonematopsis contorta HA4267-MV1]|nr:type III-B CRISPR-associated protein Cas10/Cmr2 [Scytonematopsis contorta HA4267-MV1]